MQMSRSVAMSNAARCQTTADVLATAARRTTVVARCSYRGIKPSHPVRRRMRFPDMDVFGGGHDEL